MSSKALLLLEAPPLRTVLATFTAHGSSTDKAAIHCPEMS
jgi:hypothetical protein